MLSLGSGGQHNHGLSDLPERLPEHVPTRSISALDIPHSDATPTIPPQAAAVAADIEGRRKNGACENSKRK